MNVLIVTGHPAQVHNHRLVREELIKHGHKVFWLTTPKDIATNLLDTYGIPYDVLHKPGKNILSQAWTLVRNVLWEIRYLRRNKIDIVVTRTDPYTAVAAWLCRIPNIMLQDTEHAATSKLQGPFAKYGTAYLEPECFSVHVRPDELRWPGNIELFYLHPKRFTPKPVWNLLGIEPDTRFAIVRFVKWDAFHDTQLVGGFTLDQKRTLIQRLQAHMRVFISSESELPADLEPYRIHIPIEQMHHVQAAAALFVGESATMASESVCLATPAIYIDQVGRGYTDEEARESLLWMFRPVKDRSALQESELTWISGGVEECILCAESIAQSLANASNPGLDHFEFPSHYGLDAFPFDPTTYAKRHQSWLSTKIDCTGFLTWFIENYPGSAQETRNADSAWWEQFK